MKAAGAKLFLQLDKLKEFRNDVYEKAKVFEKQTKKWHEKMTLRRKFIPRQQVTLYNPPESCPWIRLNSNGRDHNHSQNTPFWFFEVERQDGIISQINGQRCKHLLWRTRAKHVTDSSWKFKLDHTDNVKLMTLKKSFLDDKSSFFSLFWII